LQTRQIIASAAVVAIIALALGISIGYALSSSKTTITQIQTTSTTFTQVSTISPSISSGSGQTFNIVTATEKPVLVAQYTPACATVSGHVTTVYSEVPLAESTTVTLIFPSLLSPGWGEFLVTVTTNNTNTFSSQIENTTISC
jgi:hypothetical protein